MPHPISTTKDRILKLERNTPEQLTQDLSSCKYFFICIDESTDITSSAMLAIFSRFFKGDEICQEMIALLTLPECTIGAATCRAAINEFSSRQIDISKVVFVTTDGAPSMTGEKAGFVSFVHNRSWSSSDRFSLHHKRRGIMCKSWPEGTSGSDANSYQSCKLHFCLGIT